jgi:hypothetical protein
MLYDSKKKKGARVGFEVKNGSKERTLKSKG